MISTDKCIGCQACVECCPVQAISFTYDLWGDGKAHVNLQKCVNCSRCDNVCPAKKMELNPEQKNVFAVVSKKNARKGSSGGFFFEIASEFLGNGGVVYGAAFDVNLKLIHVRAKKTDDLTPLCKSKYVHSDMAGVYTQIGADLKRGTPVLFVGTPCQTSAVKNLYKKQYQEQLLLIDFLCHGTGTQKVFDICKAYEEQYKNGTITDFCFRSKSRKAEHSFTYSLNTKGRKKLISGYGFEYPYYNGFLSYTIFQDACYRCEYARTMRVGDLTLGDFWGIQKFDSHLKDYKGVSMISVNTKLGDEWFQRAINKCEQKSFPIECATSKNQSFTCCGPASKQQQKKKLAEILSENGPEALVKELKCPNILKSIVYAKTPQWAIWAYDWVRGRK